MTRKQEVLELIRGFSEKNIGVSRQTIGGVLGWQSNRVTSRVRELLDEGHIYEFGSVHHEGRRRSLLWARKYG